jgi:hypothetical protein
MTERIDTKAALADMRATKHDLQGESPVLMTIPFNRLNRWIDALAQEIAQREAREPQPMTDEEAHAYGWAISQGYQSVAARYAKTLAKFIERVRLGSLAAEENL